MRAPDALELAGVSDDSSALFGVRAERALGLALLERREIPTGPKITVMR